MNETFYDKANFIFQQYKIQEKEKIDEMISLVDEKEITRILQNLENNFTNSHLWEELGLFYLNNNWIRDGMVKKVAEILLNLFPSSISGYNLFGQLYYKLNEFTIAEKYFFKSLELEKNPIAHNFIAKLLRKKNELDIAEKHARKSIKLNFEYADAYCTLSNILMFKNRHNNAIDDSFYPF
jgi:tetratricopeptide (TPR) repeat protein